jgi:hypothetical protein
MRCPRLIPQWLLRHFIAEYDLVDPVMGCTTHYGGDSS